MKICILDSEASMPRIILRLLITVVAGIFSIASAKIAFADSMPPSIHSGQWAWFGGQDNLLDTTLHRTVDLSGKTTATLSFWTWYDIEDYWDFGFVQVSTDGGSTVTSLPIAGTTLDHDLLAMPSIVNNLPGFTDSSSIWLYKTYDLAAYVGQPIVLQFRYMTDWAVAFAGFYVDDISVVADGAPLFFDDVEAVDTDWLASGWTRVQAEAVPEPTTMLLLGTGLVGIAGAARRKKKNQA